MIEKWTIPRDSNRLPGGEYTEESITKTNNSSNIRNPFYGYLMGLGEVVLWKKTESKISCHCPFTHSVKTLPANCVSCIFRIRFFQYTDFKYILKIFNNTRNQVMKSPPAPPPSPTRKHKKTFEGKLMTITSFHK
jgi:hypothetical protein